MIRSLGLLLLNPVKLEYLFTAESGENAEMRKMCSPPAGSAVKRWKEEI